MKILLQIFVNLLVILLGSFTWSYAAKLLSLPDDMSNIVGLLTLFFGTFVFVAFSLFINDRFLNSNKKEDKK